MRDIAEESAMERDEFLGFMSDLKRVASDRITPSQIARAPFNKIRTTIDLHWIREMLNSTPQERHDLGIAMMMSLREAYASKVNSWPIPTGIRILFNEPTNPQSSGDNARSAELNFFIRKASEDALFGSKLPFETSIHGDIHVRPRELLKWALQNKLPVDPDIQAAIASGDIGSITPNPRPGRRVDENLIRQGKVWRQLAHSILMDELKAMSATSTQSSLSAIIRRISTSSQYTTFRQGYTENSIKRELTEAKFSEDRIDLSKFPWLRSNKVAQ